MRKLATLFFLLLSINGFTQDLIHGRQTSFYTYIFRLTPSEARHLYSGGTKKVDEGFFHTLVDSFQTDSAYRGILPEGHYLRVYARKNKVKFDVTTVQDFDVRILKNNTDLCIRVFDYRGKNIPDAKVRVSWKHLRYDTKTKAYIDRKSGRHGLVRVTVNDFTGYYDLDREYRVTAFKRTTRKILYGAPLKYVWVPVEYVVMLPVDGVISLIHRYPRRRIYSMVNFFRNSWNAIACLFSNYYCDYNYPGRNTKGYMVFNKPKYMPGDTVRFKAYLMDRHNRPLDEEMYVLLFSANKIDTLTTLKPYREGGYDFSFFLHDSLRLRLDQRYLLKLESKNGRKSYRSFFRYEDYELSGISLELRMEKDEIYRGQGGRLFAKGTDENGLNILDGRLLVTVKSNGASRYFADHVFVPDTLVHFELPLDQGKETEISLPDSVFPVANLSGTIDVRLLTTDNDNVSASRPFNFYHERKQIQYSADLDSFTVKYLHNGKSVSEEASVYGVDRFNNKVKLECGILPVKMPIIPYYNYFLVKTDNMTGKVDLSDESPMISCVSERTADSIKILVQNPREIPFSYFIYKRNNEKERGYSDSLFYNRKARTKQNFFVSVQYLWGGAVRHEDFKIPLADRELNISVAAPKLVYPSQKTDIELTVTDYSGKPVEGADVTAFCFTGKFTDNMPDVPDLVKSRKNKTIINNFNIDDHVFKDVPGLNLDYEAWKLLAGIDSLEYYKFIYPGKEMYVNEYVPLDSLTQFSPFIVSKGSLNPVHVIYVDNKPVWFSWSNTATPYSFPVDSGYHHLMIRTSYKKYSIDSVYFKDGLKKIISIGDSIDNREILVVDAKPQLSESEKRVLYKYIFPYHDNFGEKYAFIQQDNRVYLLNPGNYNSGNAMAGPVYGTNVTFRLAGEFTSAFIHEPFFQYEFEPGLLKMRSIDPQIHYPKYL
ncbi:MAG TPA: hypothetical protein VE870_05470, partial [Bacteroidales bacterium]|nr:hypothetical protein [Bacteroidales bacterium]